MDFPKKQQQCLIPRYLLQYLTSLEYHHTDPTAEWGGGGGSYTAGTGIEISDEDVISIDNTVALKTDLLDYVTTSELTTELSNYVTSTDLAAELLNYAELSDLATVATTGSYNDLLNKPTIPTDTSDLTNGAGYITSSALSNYVTTDTAQEITGAKVFKGSYKITCQSTANEGASVAFKASSQSSSEYPIGVMEIDERLKVMKFSVNGVVGPDYVPALGYFGGNANYDYVAKLPKGSNKYSSISSGDVYLPLSVNKTKADSSGNISLNIPTNTSDLNNDSGYITSSALTGYATETWVTNQGYSTFSGSYNDLTDTPTIPTVPTNVSAFTNDAGYITSSALNDYVTTNTNQDITGKKTFKTNPIDIVNTNKGIQLHSGNNNSTNSKLGFTLYNSTTGSSNNEVGFLEANTYSASNNGHSTLLGYYNTATTTNYSNWDLGFAYNGYNTVKGGTTAYKLVIPNQYNLNSYNTKRYIPIDFTDGTNTVRSSETGIVDISSLLPTVPTNVSSFTNDAGYITGITSSDVTTALGYTPGTSNFSGSYNDLSNKPSIPDAVSGTNDGTNWTSLTIGSDTYGIPSGGSSSGPTVTRYTGYASYPITYAVPSGQTQYSYIYISIYSSELSGFLNYDNVNPGDILYINTTLGYTLSDNKYYRSSKLFTVSVPPKPDSTYPVYTTSTDDPADGNVSGLWACSTVNRITNTQETIASNIVKRTANGLDATNNFYIRVPLWGRSNLTISLTVDSITHIAF